MSVGAAGYDLMAHTDKAIVIQPLEYQLIPTGIAISLPPSVEAQVRPRSGLALKHGLTLLNSPGTIDSDYRGEIKVIMINFGKNPFTVRNGDRIAQLVFQKVLPIEWNEVEILDDTLRGDGGFGHTGVETKYNRLPK